MRFFGVVYFPIDSIALLKGNQPHLSYNNRVDHLTEVLKKEIKETDTVFYFDWVEGGVARTFYLIYVFQSSLNIQLIKFLNTIFIFHKKGAD